MVCTIQLPRHHERRERRVDGCGLLEGLSGGPAALDALGSGEIHQISAGCEGGRLGGLEHLFRLRAFGNKRFRQPAPVRADGRSQPLLLLFGRRSGVYRLGGDSALHHGHRRDARRRTGGLQQRAESLGYWYSTSGDFKYNFLRLKQIQSVTSEDLKIIAQKLLNPELRCIVIGRPLK